MVKKAKVFKPGDYVFAKVKGYPAWPAKVTSVNGKKYKIFFYGTGETGNLPSNDIFDYFENKTQFLSKAIKRRDYNEGLTQIQDEITGLALTSNGDVPSNTVDTSVNSSQQDDADVTAEEPSQNVTTDNDKSLEDTPEPENEPEAAEMDTENVTNAPETANNGVRAEEPKNDDADVDMSPENEVQNSVSEAKEPEVDTSIATPAKPKRGSTVAIKTPQQRTPRRSNLKQEIITPKVEIKTPQSETISRSGRKIKPKRYLDEDEEEAADAAKVGGKRTKLADSVSGEDGFQESNENNAVDESEPVVKEQSKDIVASEKKPKKGTQNGEVLKKITDRFNIVNSSELENLQGPFNNEKEDGAVNKENLLLCYLPSGKFVGIKLFQDRPESFGSSAAKQIWENTTAKNSLRLKRQLENGETKPESIATQLETELNLTEEEMVALKKERELEIQKNRLNFFRVENKLLDLEIRIKSALSFKTPEVQLCLDLLIQMSELEARQVMLLKHPSLLETVKRIRRYVGNKSVWKLTEEEEVEFDKKAHLIRKKAEHCFNNFKSLFTLEEGKSFWETFSDMVLRFKKCTKDLNEMELLDLIEEPTDMWQPGTLTMKAAADELAKENDKYDEESGDEEKEKTKPSTKNPESVSKSQKKDKEKVK